MSVSAANLAQASDILRRWQAQQAPAVPASGSLAVDGAALHLDLAAPTLAGQAFEALKASAPRMRSFGPDQLARANEDLVYITRFVAAALLAEDPGVFLEFLDWRAALLSLAAMIAILKLKIGMLPTLAGSALAGVLLLAASG